MRTVGTFKKIYEQAREYINGVDVSDIPTDPVVRLERDGRWVIESRLEPSQETVIEVSLDEFQSYFYESFKDKKYIPTEEDVSGYVKFVEETQI